LNGARYGKQYVEGNAQQVDSVIVGRMECVTVNINVEGISQQVDSGIVG